MKGWLRVLLLIIPYIFIVGGLSLAGAAIAGVDYDDVDYVQNSEQILIVQFFQLMGSLLVFWIFMKYIDKEPFIKLGFHTQNRLKEFIAGILIGLVTMSLGYFILIYLEEIFFIKINFEFKELLFSILIFTIISLEEEILIRGYVLKNLMNSFNKYIALVISSILFSLMHLSNPHINFFSLFDLFLAGIVLGLSYIYTKNLWFPIAMHLSWNLFQALFGFNVSGQEIYSIIEFGMIEKNSWNGGDFGLEGSYLSIIAELIIIIGIGLYYHKNNKKVSSGNLQNQV
jgi:membrane protease YdiL (CAAX protease family)